MCMYWNFHFCFRFHCPSIRAPRRLAVFLTSDEPNFLTKKGLSPLEIGNLEASNVSNFIFARVFDNFHVIQGEKIDVEIGVGQIHVMH